MIIYAEKTNHNELLDKSCSEVLDTYKEIVESADEIRMLSRTFKSDDVLNDLAKRLGIILRSFDSYLF